MALHIDNNSFLHNNVLLSFGKLKNPRFLLGYGSIYLTRAILIKKQNKYMRSAYYPISAKKRVVTADLVYKLHQFVRIKNLQRFYVTV